MSEEDGAIYILCEGYDASLELAQVLIDKDHVCLRADGDDME